MKISVSKLGLSAYLKMRGRKGENVKMIEFKNKQFIFESEKTLEQWKIEYLNTCCYEHDSDLCELRKYFYNKQNRAN